MHYHHQKGFCLVNKRLLFFIFLLTGLLSSCVSSTTTPVEPNIELEGATTEEIEEGSFVELRIDYSGVNAYRNELYFLALGEQASEGSGYYIDIIINPDNKSITNPRLVLPSNFELIGNPNSFSTLSGTCNDVIFYACSVRVLFTPKNNFLEEDEILFHYVYQGKGYRSRVPFSFKSTGKLNANLTYGPISNGVGNNMCAVGIGGEIKCWGDQSEQNLGVSPKYSNWGDSSDELGDMVPYFVTTSKIKKLRMSETFGCVQFIDNTLKCFGKNNDGALGRNNSLPISLHYLNQTLPIVFPEGLSLLDFSLGMGHVCALFAVSNGPNQVRCWGRNDYGQAGTMDNLPLGYGYQDLDFVEGSLDVQHQYPANVLKVVSSNTSNCMLFEDGKVKCWGDNLYGQLGLEDQINRGVGTSSTELYDPASENPHLLVNLGDGKTAIDLYAGPSEHFCAKLSDTELKCWGRNDVGQLGLDDRNNRGDSLGEMGNALGSYTTPAGFDIVNVAIGQAHTCVHIYNDTLTGVSAQQIYCFGDGASIGSEQSNSLGDDGGEMAALQALRLGSSFEIQRLFTAGTSTCVASTENKIRCFGRNEFGQLGTGNTQTIGDGIFEMNNDLADLRLPSHTTINEVVSTSMNTCVVLDDKKIACIGSNAHGFINSSKGIDLGTDPGNSGAALAALPLGNEKAIQVSVGYNHACAVFENRKIKCWGKNEYGQLGYENTRDLVDLSKETTEIPFVDLGDFVFAESVHAGKHFTCAVVYLAYVYTGSEPPPHRIKCWGRNHYGQLGQGHTNSIGDNINEMGENLDFIDLGEDASNNPFTVVDFDSGNNHNCAIVNTTPTTFASPRKIKCWGFNDDGQLGLEGTGEEGDQDGEMGNNLNFVSISTSGVPYSDFSEIKLGHDFSCARRSQFIYCWGKNEKGQLGAGNTNSIGDNGGEMDDDIDPITLYGGNVPNATNFNFSTGVPIANAKSQWAVGGNHVCVISADAYRNIFCWGDGMNLGAGYGSNVGHISSVLATKFTQNHSSSVLGISAQADSTCLHYADGMAKCWGKGRYLGNGRNHDMGTYYRSLVPTNKYPVFPYLWF